MRREEREERKRKETEREERETIRERLEDTSYGPFGNCKQLTMGCKPVISAEMTHSDVPHTLL